MTEIRMRALQTFSSLEGRRKPGREFSTNEEHAAYLASQRLAEYINGPPAPPKVGPTRARPTQRPSEFNNEIIAVGGGWYEWRGRRYRGKKAAEEAKKQG